MANKEIVGIIGGKGKMGKFFADFFQKNGFEVMISDLHTKHTNSAVAKKADIVIIAVPMERVESVVQEVAPLVRKDALLMDINSIKAPVVVQMLKEARSAVLGCHPMFGPTNQIAGQVCIFCPGRGIKWQKRMTDLFRKNAAEVRILSAEKHDELMTLVQGLMHFLDIATAKTFAATGIPIATLSDFRSPSYRLKLDLMGRTLYQDAGLYGNIQIQNPENIKILKTFFANAQKLFEVIQAKDLKKFTAYWDTARKYLGGFAKTCQQESDEIIDFLSAAALSHDKASESLVKNAELGILGPAQTFSHLAAQKFFPKMKNIGFFRTIPEIFAAFRKKEVASILVPIENKLHGSVRETMDELFLTRMPIKAMFRLPVRFVLAGLPGAKKASIRKIASHEQALAQCSGFLQKEFSATTLRSVSSTAVAIAEVIRQADPTTAVICSPEAAKKSGLRVLAEKLANGKENETWFAFLSHHNIHFKPKKSFERGSVVFFFNQDSPGSLASVLAEFSQAKINLTKIESRPAGHSFGDYLFFLDFEGSIFQKNVQEVFARVEKKVAEFVILGSYPVISEL